MKEYCLIAEFKAEGGIYAHRQAQLEHAIGRKASGSGYFIPIETRYLSWLFRTRPTVIDATRRLRKFRDVTVKVYTRLEQGRLKNDRGSDKMHQSLAKEG
jgi:hypothetical protein